MSATLTFILSLQRGARKQARIIHARRKKAHTISVKISPFGRNDKIVIPSERSDEESFSSNQSHRTNDLDPSHHSA